MQLHVYETSDGFNALKNEWAQVLAVSATNEVFLTWEWHSAWWEAYLPGDLWLIAARDEAGTLVGVAPWYCERNSRIVRMVGGVDVTDYLDIIVAPEYREAFCTALADWLHARVDGFSTLSLCNIPANSPTIDAFPHALAACGFLVETKQIDVCPLIVLPDTFDTYVQALDKKNRHELRRKLRRAEENDGDKIEWYIVGKSRIDEAHNNFGDQLECFLSLMAASHPEKALFLKNEQHTTFFRTVMPKLYAYGWVQLSFLTINGDQAAAYISLDYGNRIGLYNSGLKPALYSHLSPGIVLLAYIIEYAIAQKRTLFDFLRGNEDYKYRMGAHDTSVLELRATLSAASTHPVAEPAIVAVE